MLTGRGPSCPPVPTSSGPDMRQNSVPHIGDAASAWAWEPEPGGPPGPRGVGAGRGGLLPMGRGMCGLVCAVPRTPPPPAACSGREEGASAEWPVTEPRELYRWVCGEGAGPKGQHNLTWSHAFWPRGREKRTSCSEEAGESPGGSGRLKMLQCPQVTWGNASVITKALQREAGGGGQVSEIKRQMTGRGARW